MNEAGEQLGAYSVIGAGADDWEDMARGPGGDGDLLYIGDIGVFETLGIADGPAMVLGVDLLNDRRVLIDYPAHVLLVSI